MKMNNNNSKDNSNSNNNTIRGGGGEEGVKRGFYACYILTSLSPRHKGHTYIGYTVNPCRRIRQHNGEIVSGAYKTKRKRPWDMVLCIFGFPTNVSALQFEWAWQHPTESLAVKQAAASFKTLGGLGNKVKLAYTMLTLARWQDLKLTVNFFSSKYTKLSAGCPTLPEHMSVQVSSMDDLPCYTGIYSTQEDEYEDEDRDDLDVGDLVDETDIIGKSTKEGSESTTGKTGTTDASINEGLTNISGNNDRYGRTTTYGGSSVNYVNDSDHLFSWTEKIDSSFDLGLENGTKDDLERSSINLVSRNISSYDATTYGGSSDNYVNDSDHLFSWPEKINSSFDLGLENGTKDDLERSSINLGSTNIPSYDATTYGGSSDNYVSDSDHLFSWTEKIDSSFDLGLANGTKIDHERSSINLGSTNIPGNDDMSGMTAIYRGTDDNFVNKSDFLFNSTENNYMFDVGINVSPEEDLTRYGDLYSSIGDTDRFGSNKDDRVEIDQPNKEIITRKGVCNYQPAANSPITSQEVEVIDLSTPSPGYGVGLKGKRRRVSGGVIDLTKSPIFVEV